MIQPSTPLRTKIWPKVQSIFKALTISVFVGLVSDYSLKLLDIESWEKFSAKTELFNTALMDNALNLNPFYLIKEAFVRIKTQRYYPEFLSWEAPFNVTQACENRTYTYVPNSGILATGQYEYKGPPLPYNCQLDEATNPYHIWEYPLAIPDVALTVFKTAWGTLPPTTIRKFNKEYPVQVATSAKIIPWIRRGLLLLCLFTAVLQTGYMQRKNEISYNDTLIGTFINSLCLHLFTVSIAAVVLYGIMKLVLWVGNQEFQFPATTGGLSVLGIILKSYFDELKSMLIDSAKEKISHQLAKNKNGSTTDKKA